MPKLSLYSLRYKKKCTETWIFNNSINNCNNWALGSTARSVLGCKYNINIGKCWKVGEEWEKERIKEINLERQRREQMTTFILRVFYYTCCLSVYVCMLACMFWMYTSYVLQRKYLGKEFTCSLSAWRCMKHADSYWISSNLLLFSAFGHTKSWSGSYMYNRL